MTTTVTTGSSGSGSRRPSRAARRSRRRATPSSAGRSDARTSNVAEVPFTLDHPAYNWFALGATARIALGAPGAPVSEARAARAIGVAEVVVPDDPRQDDAVRELVIALVRQGVTSTVSRARRPSLWRAAHRLQPARRPAGDRRAPTTTRFVAAVLDGADPGYRAEFDRQLASGGRARLWVPEDGDAERRGGTASPTCAARATCPCSSSPVSTPTTRPRRWTRSSPTSRTASSPSISRRSWTVRPGRPRTTPSRSSTGACRASTSRPTATCTSRSCARAAAGRPASGSIRRGDRRPTARTSSSSTGATRFDYAIAAAAGRLARRRDRPRRARLQQPARRPGVRRPPGRPARDGGLPRGRAGVGRPDRPQARWGSRQARMAGMELDPPHGIALRLYESSGRPTQATIRSRWPIAAVARTNLLEEDAEALPGSGTTIEVRLEPYEIVTSCRDARGDAEPSRRRGSTCAPRGEAAQPVFSDYWLHNKGAAPMGYQSVTVQIKPSFLAGEGPFDVPDRGRLRAHRRRGRRIGRAHRPARLGGGARRADLSPGAGRGPGLRGVGSAGRRGGPRPLFPGRADHGRGGPDPRGRGDRRLPAAAATARAPAEPGDDERSAALGWAVERALTTGGIGPEPGTSGLAGTPARSGVARSTSSCWAARSRRLRAAAPRSACRSRTRPPARSAARPRS